MKRTDWLLAVLLVLATVLVYVPAYDGAFLWDDDVHVSQNPFLQNWDGLKQLWHIYARPQYYPMTYTSFWLDYRITGLHPLGYHVTNVALHAVGSLLVVALLRRLGVPNAWLGGFIFALHPVHVESVAWISERKNNLSIVFALAAMCLYPLTPKLSRNWWLALLLFVAAVLSKTITCAMPAVLLVIVWWREGRITRRHVQHLVPFFAIGVTAGVLTPMLERTYVGAEGVDWSMSFAERVIVAGRALWWYAGKMLVPVNLAFSYERWVIDLRSLEWAYPIGAVVLLFVLWRMRERWGRGPLAAALIFGGVLLPALGFFNLYPHRYSFVADHFQYHANIAAIAVVCFAVGKHWRRVIWVIPVLGVMTFMQARIYAGPEPLWRDTIAKTPDSWLAHHSLAIELINVAPTQERLEEAIRHVEQARRFRPQHDTLDWTLGDALRKLGREDDARRAYERSVARLRRDIDAHPNKPNAYLLLHSLLMQLGRSEEALTLYCVASDANPNEPFFAECAAKDLLAQKRLIEAIPYLERWTAAHPDSLVAHLNLGYAYGDAGRLFDARREFLVAKEIHPTHPGVVDGLEKVDRALNRSRAKAPRPDAGTPPG